MTTSEAVEQVRGLDIRSVGVSSILTPASGFMSRYRYTLNPYSGCSFGCSYCYARYFTQRLSDREHWGRWVGVKERARAALRRACARGDLVDGDAIYISTVTDPYQPIERRLRLTRGLLEDLLEFGIQPRMTIQTRSPLVVRDLDLLRQFEHVRVNMTVTTDDDAVRRRYEPSCPPIEARLDAARLLADAGLPIGISLSPLLPLRDARAFGAHLAEFDAAEYVTQYVKLGGGWFVSGTPEVVTQTLRDDGWDERSYHRAVRDLRAGLGERVLLEGMGGYAPAE
ncbi:MAG: radical SAM protein [Dehalococcoidia bacterium]